MIMSTAPINPANTPVKAKTEADRIPMSVPLQRLQVVDIPGYHTHWMRGTPERIQQALRAGYTYVQDDEVQLNYKGLASSPLGGGNSDLGSQVSVPAGRTDEHGQTIRLILMKLPIDLWNADQKALDDRQDKIAEALRTGQIGQERAGAGSDTSNRYIPKGAANRNIFIRRT
jgi:hypothetical protein